MKKTLPKCYHQLIVCVLYAIFVVNARIVKVKIKISVASIVSRIMYVDTKYLMVKTLAETPTLSTSSLQMLRFLLPFRP